MLFPSLSIALGGFLLLVSLFLACWVFALLSNACSSRDWLSITGTVTESHVVSNHKCNGLPGWHYFVAYEYAIEGNSFRASNVRAGCWPYLPFRIAKRTTDCYPELSTITVYYAPEYPEASVLEPGWSWECLYSMSILAITLAAGLALIYFGVSGFVSA
jgi:hypothetical protein